MTKPTAKAKVLEKHKDAFICHCFAMFDSHPFYKSAVYEAVFIHPKSAMPLGIGFSKAGAWKVAAANLKRNLK